MAMQCENKQSIAQRWNDYQPSKAILFWACVATAIATMIVGFSWGGWVTGGTSQTHGATAGDVARGELASAICVERFKAAPDAAARLVEFKAITDSYKKRQFVGPAAGRPCPARRRPTGSVPKAAPSRSPSAVLRFTALRMPPGAPGGVSYRQPEQENA